MMDIWKPDTPNKYRYTPEANSIDTKFRGLIEPFFNDLISKGYSPRDVSHLVIWCVMDLEVMKVLDQDNVRP